MRRCLERFVKSKMFQSDIPSKTNKRFFPRLKTLKSHGGSVKKIKVFQDRPGMFVKKNRTIET